MAEGGVGAAGGERGRDGSALALRRERTRIHSCASIHLIRALQGYLNHNKTPTPLGLHRALGIVLLQGIRGMRFLVSEVPL